MVIDQPCDTLGGARIRLRPLRQEDVEMMQTSVKPPEAEEQTEDGERFGPAPEYEQEHLRERLLTPRHSDDATWAIETIQGQVVGAIGTAGCHRRRGTFTLTLALMRPFRRQGYGREAVSLVLGTYFHRGYQKVTVSLPTYNEPATRFFDALGFTREGRLRNVLFLNGQHYDQRYFGLTAEEFALFKLGEAIFLTRGTGGQS